jgi:hypothetical protein
VTPGDGQDDGRGFLRDMADQSARAHEFDRRLRWSRLSKRLRGDDDVAAHAAEAASDDAEAESDDVVDLRDDPEPVAPEPATTSAAPEVPRPRRREPGPGRPTGR